MVGEDDSSSEGDEVSFVGWYGDETLSLLEDGIIVKHDDGNVSKNNLENFHNST